MYKNDSTSWPSKILFIYSTDTKLIQIWKSSNACHHIKTLQIENVIKSQKMQKKPW